MQEAGTKLKEFRPTELEGMTITYRGARGLKNKLQEAVFTRDDRRWGSLSGELNEQALREMAERAAYKYQQFKQREREKAAREA